MSNLERTTIKVLKSNSEYKLKEKGSTFIGQAFSALDEESATAKLSEIRKKHYDATHNCFSYRIYKDKFKYSDDGEPNGTAGIRIYNAIEHFNLQNLILIVTRYYGGVKLGVGPLGKAYYQAAFEALNNAEIIEKIYYRQIKISYDYNFVKTIHRTINDFEGIILNNNFDSGPYSDCLIYPEIIDKLTEKLKNLSSGSIKVETTNTFQFK